MEAKEKILDCAEELFMQYGIRSVTMDDVSRATSMSKKTLYQHFENKDRLVLEVAMRHFEKERAEFDEIADKAMDAVHEVLLVSKCLRKHVFKMNPSLLYDLQKYHTPAWERYLDFKQSVIRGHIERNIERGKQEGLFRSELDAKVLSILRVECVQLVFNTSLFPQDQFDHQQVQLQIFDHFIHGLLTDAGREKYHEYITLEQNHETTKQ